MSRTQLYFIFGLLFAVLVAVFALQNPQPVDIDFLVWHFTGISKVLVILVSTATGALVVFLLGFSWQLRRYLYIRRLEGEVETLQKELAKARQAAQTTAAAGAADETGAADAPAEEASAGAQAEKKINHPGDFKPGF